MTAPARSAADAITASPSKENVRKRGREKGERKRKEGEREERGKRVK